MRTLIAAELNLEVEYGIQGLFMGVPVELGAQGIEQVVEIKLAPDEQAALDKSAASVREVVNLLNI